MSSRNAVEHAVADGQHLGLLSGWNRGRGSCRPTVPNSTMPSVSASCGSTRHPWPNGRQVPAGGWRSSISKPARYRMIDRLRGGDRAHAVDEPTAGAHQLAPRTSRMPALELGQLGDVVRRDPPARVRSPAQRAETRCTARRAARRRTRRSANGGRGAVGDERRRSADRGARRSRATRRPDRDAASPAITTAPPGVRRSRSPCRPARRRASKTRSPAAPRPLAATHCDDWSWT